MPEEKLGYDQIEKLAMFGAEFGNVVDGLANKKGVFFLFNLADEASALASVQASVVLAQLKDFSEDEYQQLSAKVKAKLDLSNDLLEAKVEQGLDLVAEAVDIGLQGLALVNKAKALFVSA